MKTKNQDPLNLRAMFRYKIASLVEARVGLGEVLSEAVSSVIEQSFEQEPGGKRRISRSSVYRWYGVYKNQGYSGLVDQSRKKQNSTTVAKQMLDFLKLEKTSDPYASIPEIIRRAKQKGIVGNHDACDRTTIYRKARELNLPIFRRRSEDQSPMRRFAYAHRMQMVLCDGKHFRAGGGQLKRMVYFFIDDATRYILHAVVGTSENSELFLTGLYQLICRHGAMKSLYLDHGPGFIAKDTSRICAQLNIGLILGKVRYPQGHGKIERFNDTVTQQLLRGMKKPEIDPSPRALEHRIQHYLDESYHKSFHEGIKTTPLEKFSNDTRALDFYYSREEIEKRFTLSISRKVRNDNVISFLDQFYDVPFGYAGKYVTVYKNFVDHKIRIMHQRKLIELSSVNLSENAKFKRSKKEPLKQDTSEAITTASEQSYNKKYGPITDRFGGFSDKTRKE